MLIKRKGNYLVKAPTFAAKIPGWSDYQIFINPRWKPATVPPTLKKIFEIFGLNRKDYANEIR